MTFPHSPQKGFTIVELLIVIVVIAILAAISIVAYNGVTRRANASAAQANAIAVQKAAETYNTDYTTGYPSLTALQNYGNASTDTSRVPAGVTVGSALPTSTNGTKVVAYIPLGTVTNGGCVIYYNLDGSTSNVTGTGGNVYKAAFVGQAKTATYASSAITCS